MRQALEEMYLCQISEGRMKDIYQMQQDGKSAKEIAMHLNLKVSTVRAILGEEEILPEAFNTTQLSNLKRQWAQVKTVNPEGETFRTMRKTIDRYPYEVLDQLAKNKINFVSYLAKKSLMDKHKMSLATVKKLYGGLLSNEFVPEAKVLTESKDMVTGRDSEKMGRGFTGPGPSPKPRKPEEEEQVEGKSDFRISYSKDGKHAGFEDGSSLQDIQNKAQKLRAKGFTIDKMGRNTSPIKEGYEGTILAYLKKYADKAYFSYRKLMVKKGSEGMVKAALTRGVADRSSLIYTYELPPIVGEELDICTRLMKRKYVESKLPRQLKDPKKETMVAKAGKTIVIWKSQLKDYLSKGWALAENVEVQVIKKGSGPEKNRCHIRDFNNKAEAEKWIKWYKTGKAKDTESIKMFDLSKTMKYMDNRPIDEKSPPGWEGTVRAMKKHPEINQDTKDKNIYALAWHMKNKGNKPHYKDKGGEPVKKEGAQKTFERIWLQHKRGDKK